MVSTLPAEMVRRHSNRDDVAAYFKHRPNQWLGTAELQKIGGELAFRTRISECRRQLEMHIENRQQRIMSADGQSVERVISEYRYLPYQPLGPDAATKRTKEQQASLFR